MVKCTAGYLERVFFEGEEPVRARPAHAACIAEPAAAGELWWATGWGEHANHRRRRLRRPACRAAGGGGEVARGTAQWRGGG